MVATVFKSFLATYLARKYPFDRGVLPGLYTEPELQPVHNPDEFHLSTSNTQEGARLDIDMNGFWGSRSERCFIDVRVFNPLAPSNSSSSLSSTVKKHENIKRRAYGQRIREVEHASFTPIIMSATGGFRGGSRNWQGEGHKQDKL